MKRSMIEEAKDLLEKAGEPMSFRAIWSQIKTNLEIPDEKEADLIGGFYTDLSMDGDFVVLGDNVWDLRKRQKYEKVHIDVADVYQDVEESDGDAIDEAEEAEYNQSVNGAILVDDKDDDEDERKEGGFDYDIKKDEFDRL